MRILLVEADPDRRVHFQGALRARGFDLIPAEDVRSCMTALVSSRPDLVLLGIDRLPGEGRTLLREIARLYQTPVIVTSQRHTPQDKARALRDGADDYIEIPFDTEEAEARIRAVMRRCRPGAEGSLMRVGELAIDDEAKEVRLMGKLINLSRKEYNLLRLLASRPGRVFSSEEILRHVWPERCGETIVEDVKKYVYFLRSKMEPNPTRPVLIQTVRGFGYKLSPTLRREKAG